METGQPFNPFGMFHGIFIPEAKDRGLRPGAKNGPRHFSWFKPVVADYFAQKRDRDLVTGNGPAAAVAGALPREVSSV